MLALTSREKNHFGAFQLCDANSLGSLSSKVKDCGSLGHSGDTTLGYKFIPGLLTY